MARKKRVKDDVQISDEEAAELDKTHDIYVSSDAAWEAPEEVETGEKPAETSEEAPPPAPPPPDAPAIVPLKVFVRLAGPKWDQMAGFLSYAKLNNMSPRTVLEWRAAHQTFLRMPVK